MKTLLSILVFLAAVTWSFGQEKKPDVIVKKDNTKIDALIREIDDTTIKYKRFSNPDGPQYTIKKEEVVTILYANGEVEVLKADFHKNVDKSVDSIKPEVSIRGSVDKGNTQTRIPQRDLMSPTISKIDADKLKSNLDYYKFRRNSGLRMGIIGSSVALLATGVGLVLSQPSSYDNDNSSVGGALIAIGVCTGIPIGTIGFIRFSKSNSSKRYITNELRRRGETLAFKLNPMLNPIQGAAGIRLVATF